MGLSPETPERMDCSSTDVSETGGGPAPTPRILPIGDFAAWSPEEVGQTPSSRFEKLAADLPDRVAFSSRSESMTYSELNCAANRIAATILNERGQPGEPVALLFAQHGPAIAGMLGSLKSGRPYVMLDAGFPLDRLRYILDDSGAHLVVADHAGAELASGFAGNGRRVVQIDPMDGPGDSDPGIETRPESLACISYTSGSTGAPKGIMRTSRALMLRADERTRAERITKDDRASLLFSLSWGAASGDVFPTLLNGSSLHPYDVKASGVERLEEWLVEERITRCSLAASLLRALPGAVSGGRSFPDLRMLTVGAEQIRRSDFGIYKALFPDSCIFQNVLAGSEMGSVRRFFADKDTVIDGDVVPVGYPVDHVEILLVNDHGDEVGPGEVGEIVAKGTCMSAGIWRRPELTRALFRDAPEGGGVRIYHTGDLGYMAPDGCLTHLGRKDDQVKVRGFRVEPAEVEAALVALDGIAEAAVAAREIRPGDQQLVAYIVTEKGLGLDRGGVRKELTKTLPDYMVPTAYQQLDELPRTVTGKTDRRALPVPEVTQRPAPEELVGPRNHHERVLKDIWEDELAISPIGVTENFFDLGGHSLSAARVFAQIEKRTGTELPLATIFQGPTVEAMAGLLRTKGWRPPWSSLVTVRATGSKRPFFCAHGIRGNVVGVAHDLARALDQGRPFYGLQSRGMGGDEQPLTTVEEMAAHYIDEIRSVQAEGPYLIGGFCFGGMVAFEMAQQLKAAGQEAGVLALLDAPTPVPEEDKQRHTWLRRLRKRLQWPVWIVRRMLQSARRTRRKEISHLNKVAATKYVPRTYPGNMLFFDCQPRDAAADSRGAYWSRYVEGDVELHEIEGEHDHLFTEANLSFMAKVLGEHLDRASD